MFASKPYRLHRAFSSLIVPTEQSSSLVLSAATEHHLHPSHTYPHIHWGCCKSSLLTHFPDLFCIRHRCQQEFPANPAAHLHRAVSRLRSTPLLRLLGSPHLIISPVAENLLCFPFPLGPHPQWITKTFSSNLPSPNSSQLPSLQHKQTFLGNTAAEQARKCTTIHTTIKLSRHAERKQTPRNRIPIQQREIPNKHLDLVHPLHGCWDATLKHDCQ